VGNGEDYAEWRFGGQEKAALRAAAACGAFGATQRFREILVAAN
jgi:hypothetical protein